jgi:signal peptidase I
MPEMYISTGVIGAVCVALFTIGIVSVGAKPAKSVKGLMLVRNAEGRVVSIMEGEGGRITQGKAKAPTSKVKPGLKAPQPRRHKKAKSIVTMAVVSVLLCGYSSMMVMAGYTLQDVMGGMYSPFMAVTSQRMQPTLNYGDLIIVTREHAENIVVGDIVAFNVPSPYDRVAASPTVHRVVDKWVEDGVVYFKTMGDNNQGEDPWTVPGENVIGKCVWKVPYMGYVVLALKTPLGLAAAFSALLVGALYPYVKRFLSVKGGSVQHG